MADPGFWIRANVFYDRSGRLENLFPIQQLLLEMVFLRRQEEKFSHTALMLAAMRGEPKAVTETFDAYLKSSFPFIDVKSAEEERQKKMHEELERMSNSMIVFSKPEEVKRSPLKGPSARIIGAANENRKNQGD